MVSKTRSKTHVETLVDGTAMNGDQREGSKSGRALGGIVEDEQIGAAIDISQLVSRGQLEKSLLHVDGVQDTSYTGLLDRRSDEDLLSATLAKETGHDVEDDSRDGEHILDLAGKRAGKVLQLNGSRSKAGGVTRGKSIINRDKFLRSVDGEQVGEHAHNVRAGHAGSTDGIDAVVARVPGALDIKTRRKDVDALSYVAEAGSEIIESGCTHSQWIRSTGRGDVAGVLILIPCSHGKVHSCCHGSIDGLVQRRTLSTSQTHIGNESSVLARLFTGGVHGHGL